jgi:hypothetical protein
LDIPGIHDTFLRQELIIKPTNLTPLGTEFNSTGCGMIASRLLRGSELAYTAQLAKALSDLAFKFYVIIMLAEEPLEDEAKPVKFPTTTLRADSLLLMNVPSNHKHLLPRRFLEKISGKGCFNRSTQLK